MSAGHAAGRRTRDALRRVPLFAQLPDETLARLASLAEPRSLAAGETLIHEGDPADHLYVVLAGSLDVSKRAGRDEVPVGAAATGDVVGETALLEHGTRTATVRAAGPARVLQIGREPFQALVAGDPGTGIELVRTMASRLRANEAMLQQREKLASLGTLAAGLAHELNNPASAVRRSAALLADAVAALERAATGLGAARLGPDGARAVEELRAALGERLLHPVVLDPLEVSDLESELGDVLESRGAEGAWEIAPALAALGWPPGEITASEHRLGDGFGVAMAWLGAAATVGALLTEVGLGATRIGELVSAVKTYTYLDQAPVQQVDVQAGLEDTLLILRHRIREGGVTVHRSYAPDLPRIDAYGSELNQAWTNLVDNAVDAMDGHGELHISTGPGPRGGVLVTFCDDGPGIPEDVQHRMFEPFYTTKEPGKGTGLGLHIVYSIIVRRHGGRIRVESAPGRTCFEVSVPARVPGA